MKSFLIILMLVATSVGFTAADEPEFKFGYSDGLYATITLTKRIQKPAIDTGERIELQSIPGFRKEMSVRAHWQTDGEYRIARAPLAVPLLGIAGRDKDALSRLWESLLFETGCHVMITDSSFSYDFNKASGHGVTGNVAAEAEAVAKVIEAFLNTPQARGKVTEVRLLGASYGGNIALQLAKMNAEGRLHFPLGVILALSPPVSLRATARIVDGFYAEDFASYNYNRGKLVELIKTPVVGPEERVPLQPRLMRAGIGYVFRQELARIVKKSDRMYDLGLLEKYERAGDKRGEARAWSFTQFIEEMSYPYWRDKGGVQSIDAFWSMGALDNLLATAGDNAFVYVSKDDPFNDPADLARLKARFKPPLFTVLPAGGHLGFANSEWTKTIVMNKFGHAQARRLNATAAH